MSSASLNVRSMEELAALAKAKPGTLNYVVPGIFQRLFFERFNKKHGTDLVSIPFKGGGDVLTGILSGVTPDRLYRWREFRAICARGKNGRARRRCH